VSTHHDDAREFEAERHPRPAAGPPGQFVSVELRSDTTRFLEEIMDVVRRRSEAGLGREK
jgi:hypothetical protein